MKFWRVTVPNLCISLWLALLTLVILDQFNPKLGLLMGTSFLVLLALCALSSLICAVLLYGDARKKAAEVRADPDSRVIDEEPPKC